MDINLIKLVLIVVSPTITITIIAINIHHHLAFGHDVAFFGGFNNLSPWWPWYQNPSEMTFNWNSTFQIGRQPFGWCWDFSYIGWFWLNSKTRARLLEKCHPIDGRYFELEDNGKPVWSYDVHLPCFPSSGSGFTWSRHCPWMEHFSDTCLDLIQCCPKFGSCLRSAEGSKDNDVIHDSVLLNCVHRIGFIKKRITVKCQVKSRGSLSR